MERIKQVILIRKDLKMRRGKEIAQGSHASMQFIVKQILSHKISNQKKTASNLFHFLKNSKTFIHLAKKTQPF